MERDRWQRIEALFEAASSLAEEDQQPFLEQSAAEDTTIVEEVRALLDAQRDEAAASRQAASKLEAGTESAQRKFGPYRTERLLGHGGMGAVYLARRVEGGFEQRAAIKVVASHLATSYSSSGSGVSARFWRPWSIPTSRACLTAAFRITASLTSSWSTSKVFRSISTAVNMGCLSAGASNCSVRYAMPLNTLTSIS
jgi:hypothetical protein